MRVINEIRTTHSHIKTILRVVVYTTLVSRIELLLLSLLVLQLWRLSGDTLLIDWIMVPAWSGLLLVV